MSDKIDVSLTDIKQLGSSSLPQSQSTSRDTKYTEVGDSNSMTNNVYGINHRQTPLPVPMSKERYGYTFFTRPQLNFQSANLRNERIMHPLLSTEPISYQRMIRCLLDPRMQTGYGDGSDSDTIHDALYCPINDNKNAFMPILTNNLVSISGWPDIKLNTFTSRPGPYNEGWSIVDSYSRDYTTYDIGASFRNSRGDPIMDILYYWAHYSSMVFEGTLVPYPDMIMENEIDYMTRIYRLTMDPTNRKVQKIAACGASFPIAVPTGGALDYDITKPYNDANAQIQTQFRCMGFIYQDDILIWAFNKTVGIFHPGMRDGNNGATNANRNSKMTQIPYQELPLFNNRGYPRIDPATRELQWWIEKDYYAAKKAAYQNLEAALDNAIGFNLV